jgi:hypothetical protein
VTDRVPGVPTPRAAFRALTRTFLRRFFDNEITGGTSDLIVSFFWLIGLVAAPLALMPVNSILRYRLIVLSRGPEALRILSRPDKTEAIIVGMMAASLVAALVWDSLMLERRDGLILGALPVRGRTVLLAKVAAVGIYIFGFSAAIHAISSIIFGIVLTDGTTSLRLALLSPLAHFVATVASAAFVLLSATAVQGLALILAGPSGFRRISAILQLVLVAALVIGITQVGEIVRGVARFNQLGAHPAPDRWLLLTPPVWFLGLDEWILGNAEPVYRSLALTAVLAFVTVTVVTIGAYVGVYRRVMERAVEMPEDSRGAWYVSAVFEWITRRISRNPARRASAQFFFASIGRVQRLRFVVAAAMGVLCAWIVPALITILAPAAVRTSPSTTFALSYAAMAILLLGVRIAISVPADLRAAWIVPTADAPVRALRSGLWRALFAAVIVPVTLIFATIHLWLWTGRLALAHAVVMLAVGTLLVETALWHFDDISNTRPWRPEHVNLRFWWPAYLAAFIFVTTAIPQLELLSGPTLEGTSAFAGGCLVLSLAVRLAHRRPYPMPSFEIETFVEPPRVLRLD